VGDVCIVILGFREVGGALKKNSRSAPLLIGNPGSAPDSSY